MQPKLRSASYTCSLGEQSLIDIANALAFANAARKNSTFQVIPGAGFAAPSPLKAVSTLCRSFTVMPLAGNTAAVACDTSSPPVMPAAMLRGPRSDGAPYDLHDYLVLAANGTDGVVVEADLL